MNVDRLETKLKGKYEAWYKRHSALELINDMPDEQKKAVRWFIDCGDDDFLYEGNSLVHIAMRKKEIPHEFRIRDGWPYLDLLEGITACGPFFCLRGISSALIPLK